MARNLKYQLKYCLEQCTRLGADKHSEKISGRKDGITTYSFADRKNLLDSYSALANYLKDTHPEVREVRQITVDHVQEFLSVKAETVSQATLNEYAAHFRKMERQANATFKSCKLSFSDMVVPPSKVNGGGKIRNVMLSQEHYQAILSSTTNGNLAKAVQLSYEFGLRASEIAKLKTSDIDIAKGQIRIVDSKGKRCRSIPVQEGQKALLSNIVQSCPTNGRVTDCRAASLQQAFRRELKKNGIDTAYSKTSFHACRKAYSTRRYQECRQHGDSVQQALDRVSSELGHGSNRNALMKEYICCPIK